MCVCVCVCVKVSLSSIHQNDQDPFDDQVQPFCVSRILQNKKTCKQTTIDPKFVEFSKYKIYHVGSLLHDLVVNLD